MGGFEKYLGHSKLIIFRENQNELGMRQVQH